MVIVNLGGGIGNQLFRYAAGRRLAHKWNTTFKIDITGYDTNKFRPYSLDLFNITATLATPDETQHLEEISLEKGIGKEEDARIFMPEVLNYPDDTYLRGCWEDERYFADIADIIRKEFTLKNPLGAAAQRWKEKILAAECSVFIHVRHGDFISQNEDILFAILPLEWYYECINRLKREQRNFTIFVFSEDLNWCKENFNFGVQTEFVGNEAQNVEKLYLMTLCDHAIIANSTFSWWAAWLNPNPDKKVFAPIPTSIVGTKKMYRGLTAERNENSPLDSDKWIRVPFDLERQSTVTIRPYFSLLLVVNNDASTLGETLETILRQDYKLLYEVIIIDNASTDGSRELCRQFAQARENVTLIKLYDKISDGAAYNKALDLAQGEFVLFLKGKDKLLSNAITSMHLINESSIVDIVNSVVWLREDARGNIDLVNKKFAMEADATFSDLQGGLRGKFDIQTRLKILSTNEVATPLASKVFKRKFLANKGIRFNESSGDTTQQLFIIDSMLQADEMIFTPNIFYIAPRK